MNKAVFLDKDGTLIEDVPYNVKPGLIRLLPGVGEALYALQEAGYELFIVSNQPGIARGYFTMDELGAAVHHLYDLLAGYNAYPSAFYYCPHSTEGNVPPFVRACRCRKPLPGLIQRAADDFGISLRDSWMIGDILHDVEAGKRAGCRTILIDNGNETEWKLNEYREPDYILADMEEAARTILQKQKDVLSCL